MVNRRVFLGKTAAATAGLAAAFHARPLAQTSPNDIINVAIIGIRGDNKGHPTWTARGRGQDHYEHLAGIKNVRVTHVVDVDERHFTTSLPFMKEKWGGDPKAETDFRRVLDNRDVDAVTIAAPDHWHALMTIWACQAGKDVYVEKPLSHNILEGRRMIAAARAHSRVVQVGTQRRSGAVVAKAVAFLRDGGLGKVYAGRTVVYRPRNPIGVVADSPVPQGVHYDLWLGPAPLRPFNENHFHYHWHWFWEYGTTDLGTPRSIRSTWCDGCLGSRSIPARRTASAASTNRESVPIRRRRIRSMRRINTRTAPSSTAISGTGPVAQPRPRESTSSAPKAG